MSQLTDEINKRRTFAVIAHPDAGKTSLTEKLLLFGGAIHVAGAVKSNKIKKTAASDFMEIERQRGISVATSVMSFEYELEGKEYKINILDTPGHQDFQEDTFRTLTAVDSVIIVVDCAKGVESQTRKLMEVCRMRNTPVIVFINKMDREGKNPFDLIDELESELHINCRPMTWPINIGERFKGVYNLYEQSLNLYTPSKQTISESVAIESLDDPELDARVGERDADQLREDVELRPAGLSRRRVGTSLLRFGAQQLRCEGVARLFLQDRSIATSYPDRRASGQARGGRLLRLRLQDPRQHRS